MTTEVELMEKVFLVGIERFLMEVRTERSLQKLMTTMHRELTALATTWEKIQRTKKEIGISLIMSESSKRFADQVSKKLDTLLTEFGAQR